MLTYLFDVGVRSARMASPSCVVRDTCKQSAINRIDRARDIGALLCYRLISDTDIPILDRPTFDLGVPDADLIRSRLTDLQMHTGGHQGRPLERGTTESPSVDAEAAPQGPIFKSLRRFLPLGAIGEPLSRYLLALTGVASWYRIRLRNRAVFVQRRFAIETPGGSSSCSRRPATVSITMRIKVVQIDGNPCAAGSGL